MPDANRTNNRTNADWASENSVYTPFLCRQCCCPLKVDPSLLDPSAYETIHLDANAHSDTGIHTTRPLLDSFVFLPQTIPETTTSAGESTTRDSSSQDTVPSLSQRLKFTSRVFDLVSGIGSGSVAIDHPLCGSCFSDVDSRLKRLRDEAEEELQSLQAMMEQLDTTEPNTEDDEALDTEIQELTLRESKALQTLHQLQSQHTQLHREIASLHTDLSDLETIESTFWVEFNQYRQNLYALTNEHESLNAQIQYMTSQLNKLKKTNVLNDAFRIWHDGVFGTINGMRLGRIGNDVSVTELNAALGHTLLLLSVLSDALKHTFTSYTIHPMGSHSYLIKLDDTNTKLELYYSDALWSWNRRFDAALVGLVTCVKEVVQCAESGDGRFQVPYRIVKDQIGELSIRLQFNSDEVWTKALKFLLIDLKWVIAYVTTREGSLQQL